MNKQKGFTLVEILIVIAILCMLAYIVVPQFFAEKELQEELQEEEELQEYSKVCEYLDFDYYVKIEYSLLGEGKIHLVRENNFKLILPLNSEYFLELKEMLKKGGDLGTWTFELVVTDPPGAPDSLVWHGTRSQKQKRNLII